MENTDTLRDKRVPVLLTASERELLAEASKLAGLGLSTFIRVKVLEAVNGKDR